jgi:lipid-binding SYLF domain-containing protein
MPGSCEVGAKLVLGTVCEVGNSAGILPVHTARIPRYLSALILACARNLAISGVTMQKLARSIVSFSLLTSSIVGTLALSACNTTPETETDRAALGNKTKAFVDNARSMDPSLSKFFDSCVGYAAIPSIAKGGFIVGGAYGKGEVFDKGGVRIGYCDVSQGSIGAQIGAQTFGEIIFFETKEAFTAFKGGKFALAAQASAVALQAGAGAAAKYQGGVAIFVLNPEGLMLEASVGGQQFGYQSTADVQ